MRAKRKGNHSLIYFWKQRKEKKRMHFSFLCLVCKEKGNQKKNMSFYLYACMNAKYEKKVMGKNVKLVHKQLSTWGPLIFIPLLHSKFARFGQIAKCGSYRKLFHWLSLLPFNQIEEYTNSLLISLLFLSFLLFPNIVLEISLALQNFCNQVIT